MFERFTDTARHVVVQAQAECPPARAQLHRLRAPAAGRGRGRRTGQRGPARPGRHARTHRGGNTAHHRAGPDGRPAGRPRPPGAGFHRHRPRRRPRPDRSGVRPGRPHPGPPGRLPEQTASLGEGAAGRADAPRRRRRARRNAPLPTGPLRQRPASAGPAPGGHIPFTPRAKKSLELSLREAKALHDNYIGVQHLTLALLALKDGTVPVILSALGAPAASLRAAILARYRKAS